MKFYNRTKEIEELKRIQGRAFESRSRMTVITGRRRIGKTSLALRATQVEYPTVYLFVSRKNEAALCEEFAGLISNALNCYVPSEIKTFKSLFRMMMELAKTRKFNLIIDEFQEFFNVNPSVFSDMQNIWDTYRNDTHVNLLLMGSAYSMMHKIFESYHEPLFGRADATIRLSGFGTETMKEIMRDFRPNYNNDELLAFYCITGGVPKYIELLCEDTDLSIDGMFNYVVRENSPFIDEGRNLLIEEFGKDYGLYFSVLSCIASGTNTQGAIESALGGVTVAGHLKRLIEDYSLIKRVRPIMSKPRSQNVQYEITDNFLRFWFRFIYPYQSLIERNLFSLLKSNITNNYEGFTGRTLERYFQDKVMESEQFTQVGNWWDRKGQNEIDLIAINEFDHTGIVAEIKRNPHKISMSKLQEKISVLPGKDFGQYTLEAKAFSIEDM